MAQEAGKAERKPLTEAEICKRAQTYRSEVHAFLRTLGEYDAVKLTPDPSGKAALPGLDAEEEAHLKYYRRCISLNLDLLDHLANRLESAKQVEPNERPTGLLYGAVRSLVYAAHFIGARTEMTENQRRYFQAFWAAQLGRRGGAKRRREAAETWQPHALVLAIAARERDPQLSQSAVADSVKGEWRLHIACPAHGSLQRFVATCEKNGTLPRRRLTN